MGEKAVAWTQWGKSEWDKGVFVFWLLWWELSELAGVPWPHHRFQFLWSRLGYDMLSSPTGDHEPDPLSLGVT